MRIGRVKRYLVDTVFMTGAIHFFGLAADACGTAVLLEHDLARTSCDP